MHHPLSLYCNSSLLYKKGALTARIKLAVERTFVFNYKVKPECYCKGADKAVNKRVYMADIGLKLTGNGTIERPKGR